MPWGQIFGLLFMTLGPIRAIAVYSRVGDDDSAPEVRAMAARLGILVIVPKPVVCAGDTHGRG